MSWGSFFAAWCTACILGLLLAAPGAATASAVERQSSAGLYVAAGSSVMSGGSNNPDVPSTTGYVERLFAHYQSTLGVTVVSARLGTSTDVGGSLADVNAASDTRVVTVEIGAYDVLSGGCDFTSPACPFRANFSTVLADFQAALANDPGAEALIAMAYYNPRVGGPDEAMFDQQLLGASATLRCADAGVELGLNDIIGQEAARNQALLANVYPAFKQGGPAFVADGLHPTAAGQAAITEAFVNAVEPCATPALDLKARKQRLKDTLVLSASASADSTLVATGDAIKTTTMEIAANLKSKITAELTRQGRRKLAKKLDQNDEAKTIVKVAVTTEAGGTAADQVKVKLKD